jgi:hypothetical protein
MASRRSWAKADTRSGRTMLRPGSEARWKRRPTVGNTIFRRQAAERRRTAQTCRTSAEFAPESVETAAEKKPLKRKKEASAQSLRRAHGQRSDCSLGVMGHACRTDELQRNGTCRACRSAGLSPHSLRIWRDRLEQRGNEMDWRSCFIGVPGRN